MKYYNVEVKDLKSHEWILIQSLEGIRTGFLEFDLTERLTIDQANERLAEFKKKALHLNFRISEEDDQVNN